MKTLKTLATVLVIFGLGWWAVERVKAVRNENTARVRLGIEEETQRLDGEERAAAARAEARRTAEYEKLLLDFDAPYKGLAAARTDLALAVNDKDPTRVMSAANRLAAYEHLIGQLNRRLENLSGTAYERAWRKEAADRHFKTCASWEAFHRSAAAVDGDGTDAEWAELKVRAKNIETD